MTDQRICLFVCGDLMTGRGIDQVLAHPGNPQLFEYYVRDARVYVDLAEQAHGPIPRPVSDEYIWGDALEEFARAGADRRIINLETSITTSDAVWPGKEVQYRMHPRNIGCLAAAGIDCCVLANNHVLDWGYEGLAETLATLNDAGIQHAGAGADADEARAPAVLDVPGKGRVLVFSFGSVTSGIPSSWAAAEDRPGVNLLADLSEETATHTAATMREMQTPGDRLVASIHWGSNWGYDIPRAQTVFAHRLIEEGIDLVHGHSSHHVRALELYQARKSPEGQDRSSSPRPILYGCGDFLTDYEGIGGYESFRPDLTAMYFVTLPPERTQPAEVRLIPMQVRRFRLNRVSTTDAEWFWRLLNREAAPFNTEVRLNPDHSLTIRPLAPDSHPP
jgi:poly-gamma-glutamate capsule biosynthesis protein CapA/YwtB (metallophosphatase superfamily)